MESSDSNLHENRQTPTQCRNGCGFFSKEEQAPYVKRNEEVRAKYEESVEKYEDLMDSWRKDKKAKPKRTDGKPDCNCAYCLGDETSPVALPDF